jgi:hypothetical protein
MPLIGFSEPTHIPLLLTGQKTQTTRKPRQKPLQKGDTLYMYYKPRAKKSCNNCINLFCALALSKDHKAMREIKICKSHTNYIGKATITNITTTTIAELVNNEGYEAVEEWARRDGFKNYCEAGEWFSHRYGGEDWIFETWTIITFTPPKQ